MDEKIKKLIAVGASVGANCHPCLEFHVGGAFDLGIDKSEIKEAVDVGMAVRKGSAASMDNLVKKLLYKESPSSNEDKTSSGCSSGCCSI